MLTNFPNKIFTLFCILLTSCGGGDSGLVEIQIEDQVSENFTDISIARLSAGKIVCLKIEKTNTNDSEILATKTFEQGEYIDSHITLNRNIQTEETLDLEIVEKECGQTQVKQELPADDESLFSTTFTVSRSDKVSVSESKFITENSVQLVIPEIILDRPVWLSIEKNLETLTTDTGIFASIPLAAGEHSNVTINFLRYENIEQLKISIYDNSSIRITDFFETRSDDQLLSLPASEGIFTPKELAIVDSEIFEVGEFSHNQLKSDCDSCHNEQLNLIDPKSEAHVGSTSTCEACHSTVQWIPIIVVDHKNILSLCSNCHSSHTFSKNEGHIESSENCYQCHALGIEWNVNFNINHDEVIGKCNTCHSVQIDEQIRFEHLNTTNVCEDCHVTQSWTKFSTKFHPKIRNGVECITCHNNDIIIGKPTTHINTSNKCESCHQNYSWAIIAIDHNEISGKCKTCHLTPTRMAQDDIHNNLLKSADCGSCHQTNVWITEIIDHSILPGRCNSCHDVYSGHLETSKKCEACHRQSHWVPVLKVAHSQLNQPCIECHNNTHFSGKDVAHVLSTNNCIACHTITTWKPLLNVDHNEVIGTCDTCHLTPTSHNENNDSTFCLDCHSTESWK